MRLFSVVIYVLAAICLTTGASDFVGGLANLENMGASLSEASIADPVADNVLRFFAAIWMGVGILFILFLRDLERYKPAMLTLMGIVFVGGIGRIISVVQYGMPDSPVGSMVVTAGLLVEIGLMPVLAWWLSSRYSRPN